MSAEINLSDVFLDNTKVSAYKKCPRAYFLRHVKDWRSEGTATPLVFGLAWHAGQDIVWTHAKRLNQTTLLEGAMAAFMETWCEQGFPEQPDSEQLATLAARTPATAEEMYYNYINTRWSMLQDCELIQAEQPFAVPLPNLNKVWYVGRLDKVIEYKGNKLVIEHKTTALYSKTSGFQYAYIEGWSSDSQVKGYQFGAGMYYPGLNQVWVDCALAHKTVHDQFRFVPISHSFDLIKEWLLDTEEWVSRIMRDEARYNETGKVGGACFPKNEDSCYNKYGQCAFLDVCRTTANVPKDMEVPPGYMVEKWSPFETLGLEKILNKE